MDSLVIVLIVVVVVVAGMLYLVNSFLKNQEKREVQALNLELGRQRQEYFLPNRFEAYQRAILFLERIHPNSLLLRMKMPTANAKVYQAELLKTIREEYNHNVAQQLFISKMGWDMIKKGREDVVRIINLAGDQMVENSTSQDLSMKILEMIAQLESLTLEIAVDFLKDEFKEYL